MLASGVALFVVSRDAMGPIRTGIGGLFMGTGIAGMHYIGMEAMRLPAMCHYSTGLVILSVIFAIVISLVALWLTFDLRSGAGSAGWRKLASAVLMGAAIPIMHYTGMAASCASQEDSKRRHRPTSQRQEPASVHDASTDIVATDLDLSILRVLGTRPRIEANLLDKARRELLTVIATLLLDAWAPAIGQPAFVTSTFQEITGSRPRIFLEWAIDPAADFQLR
jgi:hypothetical protein